MKALQASLATASPRHDGRTEDRIAVHPLGDAQVVVVADGAGGIPGGAAAAEVVMMRVEEVIAHTPERLSSGEHLCALLRTIDEEIERLPLAGETTAVLVVVAEHGLYGASCGDSGAWIVGAEDHDDLTVDQRKKLRLGSGRAMPMPFARAELAGPLVVASDGLFHYADADTICSNARGLALEAAACGLVASVRTERGDLMDDVAVALVRPAP